MEPIADKPPAQIKQIDRRPESVDGLFSATMLGIKDVLPKSIASIAAVDTTKGWESVHGHTTEALKRDRANVSDPAQQARLDFLQNQLKAIDKTNPGEREKIFQVLQTNDTSMQQLVQNLTDVKQLLGTSQSAFAIEKQKESVGIVDNLSQKGLSVELNSLKESISGSAKPEVRALLSQDLNATINVMGAPFTERVRLASIQLNANQEYQAEKTLDSALKVNTPPEVWTLPAMAHLRADAQKTLDNLYVKHNLVPLLDRYGSRFTALSGREDFKLDDIKRASGNEREFVAFKKFLTDNYSKLTEDHPVYKYFSGITRGDLENYSKTESRKVNDIAY